MSKEKPKEKVLTQKKKKQRCKQRVFIPMAWSKKALKAEQEYATFTQEQVDKIVAAAALAGSEAALTLAHEAVDETGRGVVEDKDTKNRFAAENIYNLIKNEKTVGVISEDKIKGPS